MRSSDTEAARPGAARLSTSLPAALDAPLDESNISRFLKMLDRFIDQSQFIIVTHNKRTMRRVDVMYGITMEEFGVSKPVGMRLEKGRYDHADEVPSSKAALEAETSAAPAGAGDSSS